MRALGLSAEVSSVGIRQEPSHCCVHTARKRANSHGGRQGTALTFRYMMSDNVPLNPLAVAA